MDLPTVSIILPCHNSGIHLVHAIESIIKYTKYPHWELLLIESESTDETKSICDYYVKYYPNKVKVFHTKKEGLIKAINFGIEMAGKNDVYLTQDDVILPDLYIRDWLGPLVYTSLKEPDCGTVSTINAGGVSGPDYVDGFEWFGTWSVYIPRRTIDKIGVFDELFSPGCGDDIDYSYRVYKAGLKSLVVQYWVNHHRLTEHFNDNEKLKKEHAELFRKKHGL